MAAERGKAKLRILNVKTTGSEYQKPCQTAAAQGKAKLRMYTGGHISWYSKFFGK